MAAYSTLHSISEPAAPAINPNLTLAPLQRFATQGAHGFDFFSTPSAHYLVVPNYYGCGSERGPPSPTCSSTSILRYEGPSAQFVEQQRLGTAGPAQTDHLLTSTGAPYLFTGENFNDEVCVYRETAHPSAPFQKDSCVPVPGAGAMAVAELSGFLYLVAASYHNRGWATSTPIYRAPLPPAPSEAALVWTLHQSLPTHGAHDAELATLHGTTYLFLSEDRNDTTPLITSSLLTFNPATTHFDLLQRIPTDGAHAAELFEGPSGAPFLAVANFGDRAGQRYAARSALWRRSGHGGLFERVAEVRTQGATDVEHWLGPSGRHYLAWSEEGDLGRRTFQRSFIYELQAHAQGSGAEL